MAIDDNTGKMIGKIAKYTAIGLVSIVIGTKIIGCAETHDDNMKERQAIRKGYQLGREQEVTERVQSRTERVAARHAKSVNYFDLINSKIENLFGDKDEACKSKYDPKPPVHKPCDKEHDKLQNKLKEVQNNASRLKHERDSLATLVSTQQQIGDYQQQQPVVYEEPRRYVSANVVILGNGGMGRVRQIRSVEFRGFNNHYSTKPSDIERFARNMNNYN